MKLIESMTIGDVESVAPGIATEDDGGNDVSTRRTPALSSARS